MGSQRIRHNGVINTHTQECIIKIVEVVTDFIFLGSKITVDDDYSHEIKRLLLLGRKTMTNLDSVLISKEITLLTKVCIIKAMVIAVVT